MHRQNNALNVNVLQIHQHQNELATFFGPFHIFLQLFVCVFVLVSVRLLIHFRCQPSKVFLPEKKMQL